MRKIRLTIALVFGVFARLAVAQSFQFESFPVNKILEKKATAIDWSSASDAKRFRTQLNRAFAQGIRFAGRYAVADFGCGTNCKIIAIIDMQNGRVIFGPSSEFDYEFRTDSRLLIANSPSAARDLVEDGYCDDSSNPPLFSRYYEWTGSGFKQIGEINVCVSSRPSSK